MFNSNPLDRREFVRLAALAGTTAIIAKAHPLAAAETPRPSSAGKCQPCLFTKPLGNRKVAELPAILNQLGINAVDLTCRPAGHVLPERIVDDLPKAVDLLGKGGISVTMLTTAILDAKEEHAESIVKTASQLGIRRIKIGYYTYKDLNRILPTLADAKARVRDLAALCGQYKVHAGYHLHCGTTVGAAQWDLYQLLEGLPPENVGCYYDARHATVEGGLAGWEIGLHLLLPRITTAAVKDFVWQKSSEGKWDAVDVPLGQGMVRHDQALKILHQGRFAGPISLHCEYCKHTVPVDSPDEKANWENIRRDWRTMLDLLKRAELM